VTGYMNPDGSEMSGALNVSTNVGQALKVDSAGNLLVDIAAGSSSGTQYTDGAAAPAHPVGNEIVFNKAGTMTAVSDTNALPITGSISASNPSVSATGSAIPASATMIGASDGTNLQALTLESSSNKNLRAAIYNAANQMAIDASGRLTLIPNSSVNVAQIAGVAPGLDNTNELRVSLYGKNAAAGDTSVLTDSSGRLQTANYISGSAVSRDNPYPSADQIRLWIANGQGFSCTTGKQTGPASGNSGFAIFNPNASGKNIVIFSIKLLVGNTTFASIGYVTVDPAFGSSMTIVNRKAGSGTASVASVSYSNTSQTPGTVNDMVSGATNTNIQIIQNGDTLWIPANNGIAIYPSFAAANSWSLAVQWCEI
jgi:hypothetical protein